MREAAAACVLLGGLGARQLVLVPAVVWARAVLGFSWQEGLGERLLVLGGLKIPGACIVFVRLGVWLARLP